MTVTFRLHDGEANDRSTRQAPPTRHTLVVQDDGQEGMIDHDAAVVFAETELLELVP
jgi:hypothetical protein